MSNSLFISLTSMQAPANKLQINELLDLCKNQETEFWCGLCHTRFAQASAIDNHQCLALHDYAQNQHPKPLMYFITRHPHK